MSICSDGETGQDDLTLSLLLDTYPEILAPPLNDNVQYHAFFLYHGSDHDWVLNVVEKLESSTLGFHCCCFDRDLDPGLSQPQAVLYGLKHSLKTVVIISPEFLSCTWANCHVVLNQVDLVTLQRDVIVVSVTDVELPSPLHEASYIRATRQGWWTRLLARLALPDDTPMTEETVLSVSSSMVGLTPGLQSGHLLFSMTSTCGGCGHERVDKHEIPDDLLAHGIQIPPDEYKDIMTHLMSDFKFHCHIWCYNLPLIFLCFFILLVLCLFIIPILESKLILRGAKLSGVGMEYLHGAIVWLFLLTMYMFTNHIARRKMKRGTYKRLSKANTTLIRYNILIGVENLGVADCNKYYVHFFYYELGPCLAYLQELIGCLEESKASKSNIRDTGADNVAMDMENDSDQMEATFDQMTVLSDNCITNSSLEDEAENLLINNSGEYIYRLITKKLDRPRKQRHVKGASCLCQYVEHKVLKIDRVV